MCLWVLTSSGLAQCSLVLTVVLDHGGNQSYCPIALIDDVCSTEVYSDSLQQDYQKTHVGETILTSISDACCLFSPGGMR